MHNAQWLNSLARPSIVALKAYESARSLTGEDSDAVYLDANESAFPPYFGTKLNRYPLPQPAKLLARFAEYYGVDPAWIQTGRGSDEAIDNLIRVFCEPERDGILITPPTYGMYGVSAAIQNATVYEAPLVKETWQLDTELVVSKSRFCKLVFLCSPGNPTGNSLKLEDITRVADALSGRAIVVVDEAYAEFSSQQSAVKLLYRYPNLVVLRTLSKAFGLAALRCGVALGCPQIIQMLNKVRAPYPLPQPSVELALKNLSPAAISELAERIERIRAERDWLAGQLKDLVQVYPSETNFLLLRVPEAAKVMNLAKQEGLILRDRSRDENLFDCVRVTVGTRDENERVVRLITRCLKP